MANEMFTQLPTTTGAQLTDIICAVQGYVSPSSPGLSVQETLGQIFNLMLSNTILFNAGNPNGNVAGVTYQLCWDTSDAMLFICTSSGSSTTAVWTQTSPGASSVINPAHGGTGVASPTAHTLPVAEGSSNFNFLGPLTNGQVLIGSTGADPVPATITAGANIGISNGAGTITISGTGGAGYAWTEVTGTSQAMVSDSGYLSSNAGLVTLSLPTTSAVGDAIAITGKGAGGWLISQAAGQQIHIGSSASTLGVGGSVASTNQFDALELVCITANTIWATLGGVQGNLTIV